MGSGTVYNSEVLNQGAAILFEINVLKKKRLREKYSAMSNKTGYSIKLIEYFIKYNLCIYLLFLFILTHLGK